MGPQRPNRSAGKTTVGYILGPIRIKDALFMGDQIAAKDIEFIATNKVTHIINTVSKKLPNLYDKFGVQYLSVNWTEKECNIFDKKNNVVNTICSFIDEAMQLGQSVLVHSLHGKSRAGCVIIAYLMRKFSWSLEKSHDYVASKKQSFSLRNQFLSQLQQLQQRMSQTVKLSSNWNPTTNQEELLVTNTFKNIKVEHIVDKIQPKKEGKRIKWSQNIISFNENRPILLSTTSKYRGIFGESSTLLAKLRPILKYCAQINEEVAQSGLDTIQVGILTPEKDQYIRNKIVEQKKMTMSQTISSNRVNQSHVIVNNFMNTNEKTKSDRYSSIPVKQNKQRQKKLESKSGSRLAPYENIISSFKSPYDMNFANRIGDSNKLKKRDPTPDQGTLIERESRGSAKIEIARNYVKADTLYGSLNSKNWTVHRDNIVLYK